MEVCRPFVIILGPILRYGIFQHFCCGAMYFRILFVRQMRQTI